MSNCSPNPTPVVVVTGVAGSGKTTIGMALAAGLGWDFQEGDDLHPAANLRKMSNGIPLDDDDRGPWLQSLSRWIDRQQCSGRPALLACSALKRRYRDVLRGGRGNIHFLHLNVGASTIAERLRCRFGHFMPPSLLGTQLAAWEPFGADEQAIEIDGEGHPVEVVEAARRALATLNLT